VAKKKSQLPLFRMPPDWQPPTDLPDLRCTGTLAIDLETRDEGLAAERGSSWPWSGGYICGVSIAYRAGDEIHAHYFPLRHPDSQNFEPEQIYQWIRDHIAAGVHFVTQNGIYDWGWLRTEASIHMPPGERLEEIGALATIVDENRHAYSLDALCAWRGIPGKDEALLHQGIEVLGLVTNKRKRIKPQEHLWQLPARYVGPYAEADAVNTLLLFESLNPILDREGTREAYRLEVDLLPMVLEMRLRGIRIDVDAAEKARVHLLQKRDAVFAEMSEKLSANVGMAEIGRTKWLADTFDAQGIKYPHTAKGTPSFTAGPSGWMQKHEHWLPQLTVKADKLNNAAVNFLQGFILDYVVNGRVHAEIHPHRSDEGGTRSLRFSYSDPPLQLMPSRDPELTPLIRGVFLPEEGEVWAKPDVSQQEYRFIIHYAAKYGLTRSQEAVTRYRDDPDADFHKMVAEMTGLERKDAKAVNFAKAFGAGVRKFASMINKTEVEAKTLYTQYDRTLPFVFELAKHCQRQATGQGYLKLYDDARRHWNDWEVPGLAWTKGAGPCPREEAERRIKDPTHLWFRRGPLRRADTHKAMNALIQGSAARHTKLWMRACWHEGIVPLLQMHDCLDCSVSSPEQAERVAELGREAVTLLVPIQVDVKFGRNWGDAEHSWQELHGGAPAPRPAPRPAPVSAALIETKKPLIETGKPILQKLNGYALIKAAPLLRSKTTRKIRCPFHDDKTPSLQIYDDSWLCFGCNASGDYIDLLVMMNGEHRAQAEIIIEAWDRLPDAQQQQSTSDDGTLALALQLWKQTWPIANTSAIRYLADVRGIDTDALPADNATLRFHPRCPFGPGAWAPCLIALYRDVASNAFAGIHRIALTNDVLFNNGEVQRLTLGSWLTPRAIKLWPATDRLFLGEGIETVLAAATRLHHRGAPMRPAWAAGSAGNISKFPVMAGIKELLLLVDYDPEGARCANECSLTWRRAGCKVKQLRPGHPGMDFNDVIIARATG
jgi:DNA polymerase I-like protein with 3'-5' exonuclease and polymerase domains